MTRKQQTSRNMEISSFLTVEQAGLLLGRSVATVWRLIKTKTLSATRLFGRTVVQSTDVERVKAELAAKEER